MAAHAITSNARTVRETFGLSQQVVATRAGLSLATLRKLEHGHTDLRLSTVLKVAFTLGVSPTDLLPGLQEVPKDDDTKGPVDDERQLRLPLHEGGE